MPAKMLLQCARAAHVVRLAAVGAAFALVSPVERAAAVDYTYTAPNTTNSAPGDSWAAGANWNAVPTGGVGNTLTFIPPTTTGITRFTTNDIPGNFILTGLTFSGTGPAGNGATATLNIQGNRLEFQANGATTPTISLNASLGATGTPTPALIVNVANDLVLTDSTTIQGTGTAANRFSGVVSGAGGLTKTGSSAIDFSGLNTFAGGLTLNAGTVRVGRSSTLSGSTITNGALGTGTITLAGGQLSVNDATARTLHNPVTFAGNASLGSTVNTAGLTFLGAGTLTGTRTLSVLSSVFYNGSIGESGAGFGIVKAEAGTLILGGSNNFTGATAVDLGALRLTNANAVSGTSGVTVANGGRVELGAGVTIAGKTITIIGAGGNSMGALQTVPTASTTATWSGPVIVGSDGARLGTGAAGSTLIIDGTISSGANAFAPAVRTEGVTSIVRFARANDYTGTNTLVVVGTLQLGAVGALPSTTGLTFGNTSAVGAVALDLNGFDATVAGLQNVAPTVNMPITITNSQSATPARLTVNNATDRTYGNATRGTITGNLQLAKGGAAKLEISGPGNNTYSGGTLVTNGRLAPLPNGALGTGDVTLTPGSAANAVLDLSSAALTNAGGAIADGAALTLSSDATTATTRFGKVDFGARTTALVESVANLFLGTTPVAPGDYTSDSPGFDDYIDGNGTIRVVPEPAGLLPMAVAATLGVLRRRRRHRVV